MAGSGIFELQVLEMSNYRGEVADGSCCGGVARADPADPCPHQCNTRFRVCLKEYQNNVTSSGSCSFGNSSSPVLGGNSFTLADPDRASGNLVLPFSFRWTVSFFFYDFTQHIRYSFGSNLFPMCHRRLLGFAVSHRPVTICGKPQL